MGVEYVPHESYAHVVFPVMYRDALVPEAARAPVIKRISEICFGYGMPLIRGYCASDHAHLLLHNNSVMGMKELYHEIRYDTRAMLNVGRSQRAPFDWKDCFVMLVYFGQHLPKLIQYLEDQDNYHCYSSYAQELRALLISAGYKHELGSIPYYLPEDRNQSV